MNVLKRILAKLKPAKKPVVFCEPIAKKSSSVKWPQPKAKDKGCID